MLRSIINNPLVFCILLKLYLIVGFIIFNQWWIAIEDYHVRLVGLLFIVSVFAVSALLAVLSWSAKNLVPLNKQDEISKYEKTKVVIGFSVLTLFHMIFSAMDLCTFVDRYNSEPALISSYVNADDPIIDSLWVNYSMVYNFVVGNVLDFALFYMIWRGRSWRSTFLFMWSFITPAVLVVTVVTFKNWSDGTIHPLSNAIMWGYPVWLILATISACVIPKDFTLRTTEPNQCFRISTVVNYFIAIGQAGSIFILVGKAYTLTFPERECFMTDWIKTSDPGFLLNDKDFPWSFFMVQSWVVLGMIGPIFGLCILYNFCYKWNKPNWLWDFSLVGFGMLCGDFGMRLVQEIYFDTPADFKIETLTFYYLMINSFSLSVAFYQLISLYRIKKIYYVLNQEDDKSDT